jgi:hypothetical protein
LDKISGDLANLEQINNEYFRCRDYRGVSKCRLCGKSNGSLEFDFNGYTWPEGLIHYILEHNVIVDNGFINMITKSISQLLNIVKSFKAKKSSSKHKRSNVSTLSSHNKKKKPRIEESKKVISEFDHRVFHKKMVWWNKCNNSIIDGKCADHECYKLYKNQLTCNLCGETTLRNIEYNYKDCEFNNLDFHKYFNHGVSMKRNVERMIANEHLPKFLIYQ